MGDTMSQLQYELEYEWYKPGFGLRYIMGFDDPKLEEFLNDLAVLRLTYPGSKYFSWK